MTIDEFAQSVKDWVATARHPRFNRPYTACVYQPMLELLAYLHASGFKTYIVSGGSIGRLDKALDEAQAKGWTVVNMQQDWQTIFPPAAGR